jgi:hypothetical protein
MLKTKDRRVTEAVNRHLAMSPGRNWQTKAPRLMHKKTELAMVKRFFIEEWAPCRRE